MYVIKFYTTKWNIFRIYDQNGIEGENRVKGFLQLFYLFYNHRNFYIGKLDESINYEEFVGPYNGGKSWQGDDTVASKHLSKDSRPCSKDDIQTLIDEANMLFNQL